MANEYAVIHVATKSSVKAEQAKREREERQKMNSMRHGVAKASSLVLATAAMANSAVGSYTGNKLRQSNIQTLLTIGGLGATALVSPTAAIIATTTMLIKNAIDYEIRLVNSRQESNFKRSYKGNMTTSGSRWRGYK